MKKGSNTVIPYEDIDYELVELIKCMNNIEGIETIECCCGHGVRPCQIWFVADSLKDVTHFMHNYLYRSPLWRIVIDLSDADIDENKWGSPAYLLETTCCDYYYTGVCIDNLTYKMKIKQEPCDDVVSRRAVLDTLDKMDKALDDDRSVESYKELLTECYKDLTPVTPKERMGHWIFKIDNRISSIGYYQCSECEEEKVLGKDNFCPNCGARMTESEDKE